MSTLPTFILVLFLGVVPVAVFLSRFQYKRTILFKTALTILSVTTVIALTSFLVGKYGLNHLIWYVPVTVLMVWLGNRAFKLFIQKPLLAANDVIKKLSKGDMDVNLNGNNTKFHDEIGTMNESLASMVDYVKEVADFAGKIGNNEVDAGYELISEEDQLGRSLIDLRNSLRKAREEEEKRKVEEEKRSWVNEGLAKFANILRQNNESLEKFSYQVITNLVNYLFANQGGIFLLNDEDEEDIYFEMKAAYAFNRKKYLEQKIKPGEGLVGTCAIEKQTIYMTKIPQDYIRITSGLGDANPDSLLIVPLKQDEEVLGVIEMASFNQFEPYQIEFVEKVSESIASTISSVRVNVRTNELLEKTRQQAEEMRSQEEEMRQNMEEMQATNEESERRSEKIKEIAREVYGEEEKLRAFIEKIKETD